MNANELHTHNNVITVQRYLPPKKWPEKIENEWKTWKNAHSHMNELKMNFEWNISFYCFDMQMLNLHFDRLALLLLFLALMLSRTYILCSHTISWLHVVYVLWIFDILFNLKVLQKYPEKTPPTRMQELEAKSLKKNREQKRDGDGESKKANKTI